MADSAVIRKFGPPEGAPGVSVVERTQPGSLSNFAFGTAWLLGIFRRGPEGVAIPVSNNTKQFNEIFGDPANPNWALDPDGAHQGADAALGFFNTSRGAGTLWITRMDTDGNSRPASITLNNRIGSPVLRIKAANGGRWGGYKRELDPTPLITVTSRTFAIYAPGVLTNEYKGADVVFESIPYRTFKVVSNTEAGENGEVVFTLGAQYNLLQENIVAPQIISGLVSYTKYNTIDDGASGTASITYDLLRDLTGTVDVSGNVLMGSGTDFSNEISVGDNVYYGGEPRIVTSITSNTSATVDSAWSLGDGSGVTLQADNLTVTGDTTVFTTTLSAGDQIFVDINGEKQGRTIASIEEDTSLTLESGFTEAVSGVTGYYLNLELTGDTDSSFDTDLEVGDRIIDPFRSNEAVEVTAINGADSLTLAAPFQDHFTDLEVAKQGENASVSLTPDPGEGLSVVIGQGLTKPETHFSLDVFFNQSPVLRVPDLSLDPNDPNFVEPTVNSASGNVAYSDRGKTYQKWITAENLWTSAYTTNAESDVRPANGSGIVLRVSEQRLYTVADIDYDASVGYKIYPDPYKQYRANFRIRRVRKPVKLSGSLGSVGTAVTGASTVFTQEVSVGDYLHNPDNNELRKVVGVASDTELTLESAFTADIGAGTETHIAGYFEVHRGNNLTFFTEEGKRFLVQFPQYLEDGYDGNTFAPISYYWTKFLDPDIDHLQNAVFGKGQGLVRFACPGVTDLTVQKAGISYAEARSYEFRASLPLHVSSASSAENYINQQLGRSDFLSVAIPSFGYRPDPQRAGTRLVDLCGPIMGGESFTAADARGYHVPFAGRRARLVGITSIPFEIPPSDEGIANTAGLQLISTVGGSVVVEGVRGPSQTSTFAFLHIQRTLHHYNRIFLEARTLQNLIYRPNEPGLVQQFLMIMDSFFRDEYKKGVLSHHVPMEQSFTLSVGQRGSEADIVEILNGKLQVSANVTLSGVLERLEIVLGPSDIMSGYSNVLTSGASL